MCADNISKIKKGGNGLTFRDKSNTKMVYFTTFTIDLYCKNHENVTKVVINKKRPYSFF